ncbi:hypothetical protein [Aquibacillus kalidii]|uniref:hypothetical protein n=1 Tax=Aquibacillus kalidii TaxID=2762597 RepID=UPI001644CC09|nr:hypothetical protein [Aquibacillus kalidii]
MTYETIEIIRGLIVYYFGIQIGMSILIVLLGNIMVDHFKLGIFDKPYNPITRFLTYLTLFFFGWGLYLDEKLSKHNWFLKKLLMLVANFIAFWVCIIIYYIIKYFLHAIFL